MLRNYLSYNVCNKKDKITAVTNSRRPSHAGESRIATCCACCTKFQLQLEALSALRTAHRIKGFTILVLLSRPILVMGLPKSFLTSHLREGNYLHFVVLESSTLNLCVSGCGQWLRH